MAIAQGYRIPDFSRNECDLNFSRFAFISAKNQDFCRNECGPRKEFLFLSSGSELQLEILSLSLVVCAVTVAMTTVIRSR